MSAHHHRICKLSENVTFFCHFVYLNGEQEHKFTLNSKKHHSFSENEAILICCHIVYIPLLQVSPESEDVHSSLLPHHCVEGKGVHEAEGRGGEGRE